MNCAQGRRRGRFALHKRRSMLVQIAPVPKLLLSFSPSLKFPLLHRSPTIQSLDPAPRNSQHLQRFPAHGAARIYSKYPPRRPTAVPKRHPRAFTYKKNPTEDRNVSRAQFNLQPHHRLKIYSLRKRRPSCIFSPPRAHTHAPLRRGGCLSLSCAKILAMTRPESFDFCCIISRGTLKRMHGAG